MSEQVIPWIAAVVESMREDYRETVVDIALRQLPRASSELKFWVEREVSTSISVDGFRSFVRAPASKARRPVIVKMQHVPVVAAAMICLWAEAQQELIRKVRTEAMKAGLRFDPEWSWQKAVHGFSALEPDSVFARCIEQLAEQASGLESDHYRLAGFWLSRALVESSGEETPNLAQVDLTAESVHVAVGEPVSMSNHIEQAQVPVHDLAADLEQVPTSAMAQLLQEQVMQIATARQMAIDKGQIVLRATQEGDLAEAEVQLLALLNALTDWQRKRNLLRQVVQQSVSYLERNVVKRPDLKLDVSVSNLIDEKDLADAESEITGKQILAALEQIQKYDLDKQDVLSQLEQVWGNVVKLQEQVSVWGGDEAVRRPVYIDGDEAEATLSEARAALEQISAELRRLENRLAQLRELSLNNIAAHVGRLQELGLAAETQIHETLMLGTIAFAKLSDRPGLEIWRIEQALAGKVSEELVKASRTAPRALAAELQNQWDDEKFDTLLERLADEKHDVETMLLLISANAIHPRSGKIRLKCSIVRCLLRGVEQLSKKTQPFELLNLLGLDFINGWEASEAVAQAELGLVFLAAQRSGKQRWPAELLWNMPEEWPVTDMPNWAALWKAALVDEPLQINTVIDDSGSRRHLEQVRSQVDQMLAREHGFFVRLHSLKSKRHRTMLGNKLLPRLLAHLNRLHEMSNDLQAAEPDELTDLLARLDRFLNSQLVEALSDESLNKAYEAGITEDGIDEAEGFHRRTAWRILHDCAESVWEYGQALEQFWRARLQNAAGINRDALQAELAQISSLTPLGQAALEQITQTAQLELQELAETQARMEASRYLARELLSQAMWAFRLPRVAGYLTGALLDWQGLLESLLQDLAEPVSVEEAALLLLEQQAPNQALLLTQHITLDIQKRAQLLRAEKEREVEKLQSDLLKVGGDVQDLAEDRELGRWRWIVQELTLRLNEKTGYLQAEQQRTQERARQLRKAINDLDMAIFESRATMPVDVYQLIERSWYIAKTAAGTEALLGEVETFLQEIRYRMEHQSWTLVELQNAVARLERAVSGEIIKSSINLTAETVLDLLERGELRQLGLSSTSIEASEIETRCNLLRYWLQVRELPSFLSENLKVTERAAIQGLFRYFTQMTSMKYYRHEEGAKPILSEEPVVYSWWELQYPKTMALQTACILVALPGNPPSAKELAQFEDFLEDKGWLADARFVFLFVPGCTPHIRKRLGSGVSKRGLVIIDEAAILQITLAEAELRNPLGQLRPIMLNARGAENVDVFTVNQAVNSRTAIFAGRDALVERIASSGSNYVIYGGRRIGKSSVLEAVRNLLLRRRAKVVLHSFDGDKDCSDDACAVKLADDLKLESPVQDVGDFKRALQTCLDSNSDLNVVLLLDEIDKYIESNPDRHVLVESLRAVSDSYSNRFRVVVVGFMSLYDCLQGRGPYTSTSDPWRRMFNDPGPLENLRPDKAEEIVHEGFRSILGWKLENSIPQRIVERTGGHPAFVQSFCEKLQQRVGARGDRVVRSGDVEAIFANRDPKQSFIAYVRETLEMNLTDPLSRYLILWLANESSKAQSFTLGQVREIADLCATPIPDNKLQRSLELLSVTSVVRERTPQVYNFSVPDYPLILNQLGETAHLEQLESELEQYLKGNS